MNKKNNYLSIKLAGLGSVALLGLLILAACGDETPKPANTTPPATTNPATTNPASTQPPTPAPSNTTPAGSAATPNPNSAVLKIVYDQVDKDLKLKPDALEVKSVEAVEWSDSSLGCPQPDEMYTQVITPGYKIVLNEKATGRILTYHTGKNRAVRCEKTP